MICITGPRGLVQSSSTTRRGCDYAWQHNREYIDAVSTYSQLPRRSACNGSRGTSSTSTAPGLLFIYEREIDTRLHLIPLFTPRPPSQSFTDLANLFTVDTSHDGTSRRPADVRRDRTIGREERTKKRGWQCPHAKNHPDRSVVGDRLNVGGELGGAPRLQSRLVSVPFATAADDVTSPSCRTIACSYYWCRAVAPAVQVHRDAFFSPRTFRDFCSSALGAAINRGDARLVAGD